MRTYGRVILFTLLIALTLSNSTSAHNPSNNTCQPISNILTYLESLPPAARFEHIKHEFTCLQSGIINRNAVSDRFSQLAEQYLSGIGISFVVRMANNRDEGRRIVISVGDVLPNFPADRAGILSGDRIVSLEVRYQYGSFYTYCYYPDLGDDERDITNSCEQQLSQFIREAPVSSTVLLGIQRLKGKTKVFTLQKEEIGRNVRSYISVHRAEWERTLGIIIEELEGLTRALDAKEGVSPSELDTLVAKYMTICSRWADVWQKIEGRIKLAAMDDPTVP